MKNSVFLLALLFLATTINLISQVSQEWVHRVNGTSNNSDGGNAIVLDASGNIFITGYVSDIGTQSDIVTIKYFPSGSIQWISYYNGPTNRPDIGKYIALDVSGNVYVSGSSDSIPTNSDFMTIKYNSSGVQQWAIRYFGGGPGSGQDVPAGLALDNAANVYVAGTSIGNGTSNDIAVIKYNSSGVQQWLVRYDSTDDQATAIAVDGAANIYVCGISQLAGSKAFTTVKFNSNGVRQWVRNYSSPGINEERTTGIALDNTGNVFVIGYSFLTYDFITIKYTPAGVQEWLNSYNGTANSADIPNAIITDGAGNVYVTGSSIGVGSLSDVTTVKYSNTGNQIWVQRFNGVGNSNDIPSSITLDVTGKIYITGRSRGYADNDDYLTLKYDSSGAIQWSRYYDGTAAANDGASSIAVDNSGIVYVTGGSTESVTGGDLCTVKYTPFTTHDFITGPFVNLPNQFLTNNAYSINTRVYNNGTLSETGVPIKWFINSTQINSTNIDLNSGQSDTLSNNWTPIIPGTYELKYVSSLSNDINRTNDTLRVMVQVINPLTQIGSIRICRNNLNRIIQNLVYVYDTIFVNIPNAISVRDVNVIIDTVTHTWDSDLQFALRHSLILDSLITRRGGSGDNFIGTHLNDSAAIPISSGTAPFTGTFRPESPLIAFNGVNPNGAWVLRIYDDVGGDTGELKAWCIEIQYDFVSGISNNGNIPSEFSLSQNYPNPFNPTTKIKFGIPSVGSRHALNTTLIIYDILGREVTILVNEQLKPGTYEAIWDASNYSSGIYYYKLISHQGGFSIGDYIETKKMILIK